MKTKMKKITGKLKLKNKSKRKSHCSFDSSRHAPLVPALQTVTQIELDRNLIPFTLLNRFPCLCCYYDHFHCINTKWRAECRCPIETQHESHDVNKPSSY